MRVGSLVRSIAITPRIWRQGQASKGQGCRGRILQIRGFRPLPIKPHEKIIGKGRFCLYLSAVDRAAVGTASAMIGMSQFALGGIATATAGLSGENSTVALAIVTAVSAACALSAFLVARKAPVKVHRIG